MLKSLRQKFNSITDISAEFTQSSNGRANLSGKFFYKKKNNLRLELKNLVIMSDGETSWNYNKKENKVIISSYDENDPSILSLTKIINEYPQRCTVDLQKDNGKNILVLTPKSTGINFKSVKIWIGPEDLIQKMEVLDLNNTAIQISFSNYQLNKKLPNSFFTFTPPKGSKVIDLR